MDYAVIAIGDELLIGQVVDTNTGWIARHLGAYGWRARWAKVIPDEAEAITTALTEALAAAPLVLLTGGLGPTNDDITKTTLCRFFDTEMVFDPAVLRNVEQVMSRRHLPVNELTRGQAWVPKACRVIQNEVGTAPLMWFTAPQDHVVVAMPGVPFEMQTMMQRQVTPMLLRHFHPHDAIAHRTLVVAGMMESAIAECLADFERQLPSDLHLAYLPQAGLVRLRLTATGGEADMLDRHLTDAVVQLHELLGRFIVADDDLPPAAIVGHHLRRRGLTLASAESCTGGNIAHAITEIAGSSDYFVGSVVSYATRVKTELLGVDAAVVARQGVVNQPVVEQMAAGVCRLLATDCAVATSGLAGPGGGTPDLPVGTVWMAARVGGRTVSQRRHYPGERTRVIERATTDALLLLLELLRTDTP